MARSREDQTRLFNKCCAFGALAFLLFTTVHWLSAGMRARDFSQYYMAGLIARHGAWDSLYPIPDPASPRNPGFVDDSFMKPRYAQLADASGVGNQYRYMQPPPVALLLLPLAFMSYHTAWVVWTLLMMLCMFGICVQAGRIFTMCYGPETRSAGIITLLLAVSPQTLQWIDVRNMSLAIGWMIGLASIDLLNRRSWRGASAIWLSSVSKYAGAPLVPLYIAARKWSALALVVGLSALLLMVSMAIMGWPVFSEFIHKIMPTLDRVTVGRWNQSFEAVILQCIGHRDGFPPRWLDLTSHIARLVMLVVILFLIFRRPVADWKFAPNVFAASAALVTWMLIFSPIYWQHYAAYIAPFWGWLAWEGSQGRVRRIIAIVALAMLYLPMDYLDTAHLPPYLLTSCFCGSLLLLGIAMWRLGRFCC